MNLKPLDIANASETAQEDLQGVKNSYGFVPNLLGVMAHAPSLLHAYLQVGELFQRTSLSIVEQQVVLLAVSASNQCEYCVAAHSAAAQRSHVPAEVVQAIREGKPIADARLQSLRTLACELAERRGWPTSDAVAAFQQAGFRSEQILEVVLGVGMKTLSNYTNHVAHTEVDPAFAKHAWRAAGSSCAGATHADS